MAIAFLFRDCLKCFFCLAIFSVIVTYTKLYMQHAGRGELNCLTDNYLDRRKTNNTQTIQCNFILIVALPNLFNQSNNLNYKTIILFIRRRPALAINN